jgi:hypothetical protein
LINSLQLAFLESIRNEARLSNQRFSRTSTRPPHHIYELKGIERFFPHRVNSLERLKYLYDDFKGFECDINFDETKKAFFVSHEGLSQDNNSFSEYLKFDTEKKIFWMDVKNLSLTNADAFRAELDNLNEKFDVKNRLIIEATDVESIRKIAAAGYFTSYYVAVLNDNARNALKTFCGNDSLGVAVISEDIMLHNHVTNLCSQKKQLTWDLNFRHSMNKKALLSNANDTTVLVCLLNIKSPGYR